MRIKNVFFGIRSGLLALTAGFVLLQATGVAAQVGPLGPNLANGVLTGGTAEPVQYAFYNGAAIWNNNTGICGSNWQLMGTLCDESPTTHSPTISSKTNSNSGVTWGNPNFSNVATGVYVVDLGVVQTFDQVNVFQMFSDGKITHFRISTHPGTSATPPDWQDAGWTVLNGFDFIGPGTNLGGSPNQVADPTVIALPTSSSRYVMVEAQNHGNHDSGRWIELRAFKLFLGDSDEDGIPDGDDNCPETPNENQSDIDEDGIGDACDPDIDGDGVANASDNCEFDYNPDQLDTDGDGAGDVCDTDLDGDNVIDAVDACVPSAPGAVVNADGCSIADLCPCENAWNNHGQYVKCVAHAAKDFVNAGLLDKSEMGDEVSNAAMTDCGK